MNRVLVFNATNSFAHDRVRLLSFYPYIINSSGLIDSINVEALKELALNGFYYDNVDEKVKCYYCQRAISNAQMNAIHTRQQQNIQRPEHENTCHRTLNATTQQVIDKTDEDFETMRNLVDKRCQLCFMHPRSIVLPCKHCYCCNKCIERLATGKCPKCNTTFVSSEEFYIS